MSGNPNDIIDVENGWTDYGEPPDGWASWGDPGDREDDPDCGFPIGGFQDHWWRVASIQDHIGVRGTFLGGSKETYTGGITIIREKDPGYCIYHDTAVTVDGNTCSDTVKCEGKKVALIQFSQATCGCYIMPGGTIGNVWAPPMGGNWK